MDLSRQTLRQSLLRKRSALPDDVRKRASINVADILLTLPHYQKSETIGVYIALSQELSTQAIIDCAWADNKKCYAPIIVDHDKKIMQFARIDPTTAWVKNVHHIQEPKNPTDIITPCALDFVLVPLLGFDSQGNRLGWGGGYYDRAFSNTPHPFLRGLAFSAQHVENIEQKSWDIKLDCIVTERQCFSVSNKTK